MAEDRSDVGSASSEADRPKRTPPTIDLEATEVSSQRPEEASAEVHPSDEAAASAPAGETAAAGSDGEPAAASESPPISDATEPAAQRPIAKPVSPWAIAPISGAVAAALVIGVGWLLGWPAVQTTAPAPQLNAAAIDDLTARVAGLESRTAKPAAPAVDPASAARLDAMEKSVAALRSDVAAARGQSEKLAAAINDLKSAPRDGGAPAPDLSAVNERIAGLDKTLSAQSAEIAQVKSANARPDDAALRRVVAASLLDVAVRHGDPFTAQLAAAKTFAEDPEALKPLDAFASSGVPNPNMLSRELIEIVPKLAPPAPPAVPTSGSGIVDRLQAGAAKLVKIERTDAIGGDRGSAVARITAAALRNDIGEARRELKAMPASERAPAQAWLDKTDARDAALAASRKFADGAMTAFGKPGQ